MPIQNRKSFSMSPPGKKGPSISRPSPKPAARPSFGVSRGPKPGFSNPVVGKKAAVPGFREPPVVYPPGYRRPFYRRRGSIISFIVSIVLCLICLAIVAVVWVVPALLNGSFSF